MVRVLRASIGEVRIGAWSEWGKECRWSRAQEVIAMMQKLAISGVLVLAVLLAVIGWSSPTPVHGKSHLSMERVLYNNSILIKAGEMKSLDITLETRKSGPGQVICEISKVPDSLSLSRLTIAGAKCTAACVLSKRRGSRARRTRMPR